MTLMVRDEADIVGAMLTHHREQGIDHVIVTDNASVDGTFDVLRSFERDGFVTIWHDPVHRKQQGESVTRMARHAFTDLGADWVINADADEFWVPYGTADSVRNALERVPGDVPVFRVPVVNLTGAPARDGSGLRRLTLRDERTPETLRESGIPFHPTPNAVHRGNAQVVVAQGNHRAEAPGWPEAEFRDGIEVLHLPWRSWRQYSYKVRVSGEAYLANPTLAPSPRHHGMLDFRRLEEGWLEAAYVAKHPSAQEMEQGLSDGSFVRDERLVALDRDGVPGLVPDVAYDDDALESLKATGTQLRVVELRGEDEADRIRSFHDLAVDQRDEARRNVEKLTETLDDLRRRGLVRAAWRVDERARVLLYPFIRRFRRGRAIPSEPSE
ncbi:glycosyltransferase family 2 protein [Agromyces sp. ISL-38]|uniref:glycosyltransferase family 2 protein n=1 Tax=Agromyces sp. ISL-38 TaxID=2819107 RepID=UPI001BE6DB35|nr:glycosyltransferase family 2 protein [Agromyces sp. ISL-38]MBT2500313.1 glycosyltransferase family 2 protein [Agromyces sp. ISL-38]